MLHTQRCIRFGEILMDENQKLLLLCINCHSDYMNLNSFQAHLSKCKGVEQLVARNAVITYPSEEQCERKLGKCSRSSEFLIHNINDVRIGNLTDDTDNNLCALDLDAELLNPRWYTDLDMPAPENGTATTKTKPKDKLLGYSELIEQVQPFVHFKENMKTYDAERLKAKRKFSVNGKLPTRNDNAKQLKISPTKVQPNPKHFSISKEKVPPPAAAVKKMLLNGQSSRVVPTMVVVRNQTKKPMAKPATPTVARAAAQTEPIANQTKTVAPAKSHNNAQLPASKPKHMQSLACKSKAPAPAAQPKSHSTPAPAHTPITQKATPPPVQPIAATNAAPSIKQTEQILNKLQNLGLQIKRTGTLPPPPAVTTRDAKTMELVKKLQSKGIKFSVIHKSKDVVAASSEKQTKLDFPKDVTTIQPISTSNNHQQLENYTNRRQLAMKKLSY